MNVDAYEGIIFDMDGTLVDSMPSHLEAWRLTCQHYGYPFDLEFMHGLGGVPTIETVQLLNQKYQQNYCARTVAITKRELWDAMTVVPSLINVTVNILLKYHSSKPIGVGTGAERSHAEELLTHHDLMPKLSALVTATDVKNGKPHPETFLTVAKQMNVEPNKCVVFEDTEIGAQAAKRAGMDCVLVKNGQLIY